MPSGDQVFHTTTICRFHDMFLVDILQYVVHKSDRPTLTIAWGC